MSLLILLILILWSVKGVEAKLADYSSMYSLAHLINEIGQEYNMTSINLLYNSEYVTPEQLDDFLSALHADERTYFAQVPQTVGNERSALNLSLAMTIKGLVLTFARNCSDGILNFTSTATRGRRYNFVVFVIANIGKPHELQSLFGFLRFKQFRKPLVITHHQGLFTMVPYPDVQVVNVTAAPMGQYFPPTHTRNFLGYKLRVPVQVDLPATFWYRGPNDAADRLDGIGGVVFREFMQHMNVSLETYPLIINGGNLLNISRLSGMVETEQIEISPHMYSTTNQADVMYSYPYELTARCFILPLHNSLPLNMYLLQPLDHYTWQLILCLIILSEIGFCIWLKCFAKGVSNRTLRRLAIPGSAGLSALCAMLAIPMPSLSSFKYRGACFCTFVCILCSYGTLMFSGFNLSQMYSTKLTSVMAVEQLDTPSATVQDLLNYNTPILILETDKASILGSSHIPREIERLFVYANIFNIHSKRNSLDRSFIYLISNMRWSFLKEQQRFLKHKRFWRTDICTGHYPLQYQLQMDSHFYIPLRDFTFLIREAGLYDHWIMNAFPRAKAMGYVRYFREENGMFNAEDKVLTFKVLSPLAYLYAGGMCLSFLVFVYELAAKTKSWRVLYCKRRPKHRVGTLSRNFSNVV